ncbi:MAG: pitrilysin family protein [Candidatus Firestonebacteria bacterium]
MNKAYKMLVFGALVLGLGSAAFGEEAVHKEILPCGATLLTKEVKNGVTSFSVWFKTGSGNETADLSGISHFVEHLIFKGSESGQVNQLSKIIESRGGSLNGATSKDFTYFYFTIASKFANDAMDGMMDCLLNPAFDAAELEKERKVVIEEIVRKQDNPYGYLYEKISEVSYISHPYKRPVIGTEEIIAGVSRETILKYYREHYSPENMTLVAVGDFKTGELLEKINKYFKGGAERKSKVLEHSKADFISGRMEEESAFKQTYLAYAWLGPNAEDRDTYAMDVLSVALGQGRSSRLNRQVKENKQLCYGISAGYSTMKDEGLFIVLGELEYENKEKFKTAFSEEIEKVKKQGLPQEELDKVITVIENGSIFEHETNEGQGHSLGYYETIAGYKKDLTYIENIRSVTKEDVKRIALKYLAGEPAEAGLKQSK